MGITTALTLQWVVSSSSCTSFWLLLPLCPSPPARLMPTLGTSTVPTQPSTMPTPTGQESAPLTPSPPAMAATERGVLMLRLIPATSMPHTTMEPMDIPLMDTDMVSPESPDTPELPPPSWPGLPKVLARGALMLSPAISPTDTLPSSP